jgi:hypothetical protein
LGGRRGRRAGGRKGARVRKAVLGTRRRSFGGVAESFLALPTLFDIAAGMLHRLDAMTLSYRLSILLTVTSMSPCLAFCRGSTGSGGSRSVCTAADD